VVGAGAAGIAAARTLASHGVDGIVLEARQRLGGRACTDTATLGWPFDHGCGWLHSAGVNPLTPLAQARRFELERSAPAMHVHTVEGWCRGAAHTEARAFLDASYERIRAAGRRGRAVTAAEVTERRSRWTPLLDYLIAAISGVDADAYAAQEYHREFDTGEDWPLRQGLGRLVTSLGTGLRVARRFAVRRIDWQGPSVRLQGEPGTVEADAAIVTVPTAVLRAGAITFAPALPGWKRAALDALPLGDSEKVGLSFHRDCFGMPAHSFVNLVDGPRSIGFHLRPFGMPMAVAYVGGRLGRWLREETDGVEFALDRLSEAFGSEVRLAWRGGTVTRWGKDPFTLGGYSAARPGMSGQRAALAAPLAGCLYFAGEACSTRFFATVHGAYLSGVQAATQICHELGAARGPV